MFDITGPKVLVPTILFAVMNPRLFGGLPAHAKLPVQAGFHALLFSILYFLICKFVIKVTITKMDMIVPTILFILLTPGVLLTIPPSGGQTAVLVHAAVFAILFALLRGIFPEYY
jgi:hypothetical protein